MRKTNTKYALFFAAVIGLLIFLHVMKILLPVENFLTGLLNPPMGNLHSISSNIRILFSEQPDKNNLMNEVNQLKARVNQLIVENVQLKSLEEENQILRENLKFFTKHDIRHVISKVIFRSELISMTDYNQTIIIDKGAKQEISTGLPVISSQGIIVGKVMEVKDRISKVDLITNNRCKLAASVQNHDTTSGIVEGNLGLTIIMNFIPQTEEVKAGDLVITSGLEENIPRGLAIGRVTQVSKESNDLWQSAIIEPLVNIDDLLIVSVLLP